MELLLQYSIGRRSVFNLNLAGTVLPPLCLATRGNPVIVQVLLDYGWNANEVDAKR